MKRVKLVGNGLVSNPEIWESFYYNSRDRQKSYRATINGKVYQVLWLNTKAGKPYFTECLTVAEDLGYTATAEQGKKKAEKHSKQNKCGY